MTIAELNSTPPSLCSKFCPNCGYALDGLSLADRCPECGRKQDPSEIVLYGFARGQSEGIANTKPSRVAWLVMLRLAGMFFFMWMLHVWTWWFAAIWIATIGWALYRRTDQSHPGRVQVRIYPDGVVQFEHGDAITAFRRVRAAYFWIAPVTAAAMLIGWALVRRDEVAVAILVPALLLLSLLGNQTIGKALHYRRIRRGLPADAIADLNLALYPVTPWLTVGHILVQRLGGQRYHLQLLKRYRLITLENSREIVDTEVMMDDTAATELRALLMRRAQQKQWDNRPDVLAAVQRLRDAQPVTGDHEVHP